MGNELCESRARADKRGKRRDSRNSLPSNTHSSVDSVLYLADFTGNEEQTSDRNFPQIKVFHDTVYEWSKRTVSWKSPVSKCRRIPFVPQLSENESKQHGSQPMYTSKLPTKSDAALGILNQIRLTPLIADAEPGCLSNFSSRRNGRGRVPAGCAYLTVLAWVAWIARPSAGLTQLLTRNRELHIEQAALLEWTSRLNARVTGDRKPVSNFTLYSDILQQASLIQQARSERIAPFDIP